MASLQERKLRNGETSRIIQFRIDSETHSVFLGRDYNKRAALEIKRIVEEIVVALTTGEPISRGTQYYLDTLPDDLRTRFENAGLIRKEVRYTCKKLWDEFERAPDRKHLSENTRYTWKTARYYFFQFFDEDLYVDEITILDAKRWAAEIPNYRRVQPDKPLSEATVRSAIKVTKTVFNWALDNELIRQNPFD
ncbi:MAG: phage integrase SAM-like domain-containing protein, partial [Thermoguttaceae bacterium]|nr:phage integrase SAM-like domain-containing protein [Thermoguttaceae bacterium]